MKEEKLIKELNNLILQLEEIYEEEGEGTLRAKESDVWIKALEEVVETLGDIEYIKDFIRR